MDKSQFNSTSNESFKKEILRYISFWPYLLILIFAAVITAYLINRYSTYYYESSAVIEIIDEAQDSEMALPTSLTVFNRSMINLENEIGILKSFSLHSQVVKSLNYNISYYTIGQVLESETTKDKFYDDYEIEFKINTDDIISTEIYTLKTNDGILIINSFDKYGDNIKVYEFESLSTYQKKHDLPFDLIIRNDDELFLDRKIKLNTVKNTVNGFRSVFETYPLGSDSDQLKVEITHENTKIAEDYLNELLIAFDNDGINDRQLEYRRTIDFVNKREQILKKELEIIENNKQKFKQLNNLSDLSVDAGNNINLKTSYNTELFNTENQKSLANFLLESTISDEYEFLPINVGLDNLDLGIIISEYNNLVSKRSNFLEEAGPNNYLVLSLEKQLDNYIVNISNTLKTFIKSLDIKIDNLTKKESEFNNIYNNVPENEKTLRSIERELSIKEALYLLLLQKREEAAINLAVVRPTIKIIDFPESSVNPVSPNPRNTYLFFLVFSIVIFLSVLYTWFMFDDKIHSKEQLLSKLNLNISVIGEIPFVKDEETRNQLNLNKTRSLLLESMRMLLSNLRFTMLDNNLSSKKCRTILFTSSIKGEGKTLVSTNAANILCGESDKRVIILGSDLRNPQIHKFFGISKDQSGISEILYKNDIENYKKYINRFNNLDVLFSGSIPPNPTSLLGSDSYKNLLEKLKKEYDYIIIDSAPCLLVSDTFQIIDYVDDIVFIYRANFTQSKIIDFINELYENKDIQNLNVVLNGVGNSTGYGYKYGYQYGYQYGYKYSYNYGYGYGYGKDS